MKRDTKKDIQGFTLVELLVVVAISGIVLLGALSFFERQRAIFDQQSEQAEKQANLRVAMYYLARDLALAGYTGTPFGVEQAIIAAQQKGLTVPVRPLKAIVNDPEFNALTNHNGENLDAIEIWANFAPDGLYTHLSVDAPGADPNTLYANTVDGIFVYQVWDPANQQNITVYPTGVVLGSYALVSYNLGDYLAITSVDSGGKTISVSGTLQNEYTGGVDEIGPVLRRVYFVKEVAQGNQTDRWLVRRDYYANATIEQELAQGVDDFQIVYDAYHPAIGYAFEVPAEVIISGLGAFDPCVITAVKVQMQARVVTRDMPKPLVTTMSRKIKLMNNAQPDLDSCPY